MLDRDGLKEVGKGIGESPNAGRSGGCGEGTKMVFLTSRRPRLAEGLRGAVTCCACYNHVSRYEDISVLGGHTARKVLATLENADWASPSSSGIGSFRMSSFN